MRSSAASNCEGRVFRPGTRTWYRNWPSISSAISPFSAPRHDATSCRISSHSFCSPARALSIASTWPLIRRTRPNICSLFLLVCDKVDLLQRVIYSPRVHVKHGKNHSGILETKRCVIGQLIVGKRSLLRRYAEWPPRSPCGMAEDHRGGNPASGRSGYSLKTCRYRSQVNA